MKNTQKLVEARNALEAEGIHPGSIAEDRGYYRLFWKSDGKRMTRIIPKAELPQWEAKTERYRQVKRIDSMIARIEREAESLLAEVAA